MQCQFLQQFQSRVGEFDQSPLEFCRLVVVLSWRRTARLVSVQRLHSDAVEVENLSLDGISQGIFE
jgi:hypothetical protein